MVLDVIENSERKRFEAIIDQEMAVIEYIRAKGAVYLTHTEVPKVLEGKGVGSALVKSVLHILKEEGSKVAPLCPFVAAYIKRHPEWKEILAPNYNV
ncbi:MAG: GNAT family N-acetyltransferase [Bacteroidota bacterium]